MSTETKPQPRHDTTWDEFKAEVDRRLAEEGAGGWVTVRSIDVSYPCIGGGDAWALSATLVDGELMVL